MARKRQRKGDAPTEQELLEQLAAAPLVDVLGVMEAAGVSGHRSAGEERWTLIFGFASWRIAGGPLRTDELIVRRKVREREIDKYRLLVEPNSVTRIRARVVEDSLYGRPDALLFRVLGQDDSDAELNAEVKRLQRPVKLKDPTFGTFELDRGIDRFIGRASWNGRRVRLMIAAGESIDFERGLLAARSLWRKQKSWNTKILAYAARELLPLKNQSWREVDERPLTAREFQARMKLNTISVSPDGSFEFFYDDGDLFWGHSIEVDGIVDEGLSRASLVG